MVSLTSGSWGNGDTWSDRRVVSVAKAKRLEVKSIEVKDFLPTVVTAATWGESGFKRVILQCNITKVDYIQSTSQLITLFYMSPHNGFMQC